MQDILSDGALYFCVIISAAQWVLLAMLIRVSLKALWSFRKLSYIPTVAIGVEF